MSEEKQDYPNQILQVLTQIGVYMRQQDETAAKVHLTTAILRCKAGGYGDDLAQAVMRGVFPVSDPGSVKSDLNQSSE